ncbi:MAG: isochorismatase family protein [Desulfobacterales bacterium]|nr:isochorismatase family protein [Desulfobacterales bacterium]
MSEKLWDKFLTEADKKILGKTGLSTQVGFGARPAILVIDVAWAFTGEQDEPLLESMEKWPLSCGHIAWKTLPAMKQLIEAGRAKGIPVIYTTYPTMRTDFWYAGAWAWKISTAGGNAPPPDGIDPNAVNDAIKPGPKDIVVKKYKPSGFHGTPLNSFLNLLQVDSLMVVGGVTSGCLRATVVDAFNENYRLAVIEEGCFDRFESSHAMNLFDMDAKYADVVHVEEATAHIESLENGLFNLPRGLTDLSE